MARPILYDYWRSSASYRLRIAMNLKGIAYDSVPVDLVAGAHRAPEHMARNPQGLVPALALDGMMLTQSLAIIDYLEETRPEPALLPGDAAGRARVRALAQAVAVDIHPICNLSVANHVSELTGGGDAAKRDWMVHFITRGLAAVEEMLDHPATGPFCHGDTPGLADCCLVPQLYNACRWGVDFSRLSRITAIGKACESVGAFAAAHPDRARHA